LVSPAQIEAIIGPIERQSTATPGATLKSPGLMARHYAPRTPVICTADDGSQQVQLLKRQGLRVGWMPIGEPSVQLDLENGVALVMPTDAASYSAQLYTALHALDLANLDRIVVALPPHGDEWLAVNDRLRRATVA
jgi:L-threonylcarbamoyladenylate synthase